MYKNVDYTREFEILTKRRETQKKERLEELYEKHDERVSKIKDVTVVGEKPLESD